MNLRNGKLHAGIATYLAILFTLSFTSSCTKNENIAPQQSTNTTTTTPVLGNSTGGTTSGVNTSTGTTSGATTSTPTTTNNGTKAGTTSPSTSTTTGSTSATATPTYTSAAPISYTGKSNITISGLSITGGTTNCIFLTNCTNVHITKCRLSNTTLFGIYLYNCTNVLIDSCFITNVSSGVHVVKGATIKTNNNQFLNMNGPFPDGNFVQYAYVSGGGNRIMNNRCENIVGVAQHPQDGLSLFKSNGIQGDSIMVTGNWIRGGQVLHDSGGAAGIVLGDLGGSYQVARNNILVNPGAVGAQVQGGYHIKMDHNTVYSSATTYSIVGISYGNYSGLTSWDVNMSYNKTRYYQTAGTECDAWWDPKTVTQPIGWSTNILNANISATILPTTIITMK